jgi:hypothetical protein
MAGGSGLAGLAVTGLIAALVAFGVSTLFSPSPKPVPEPARAGSEVEDLRREVERLRREVAEAKDGRAARAAVAAPAPATGASAAPAATAAPDAAASPGADLDGPLPADRKELVALIDRRVAEKAALMATAAAAPRKRVSIEEAGAEMGLSSVDVDSIKRIWRDSEQEVIVLVMGTPDMDAVKEELRSAKDDPDRKSALINRAAGNAIRNLGRLATMEDRRNRDLKRFLTPEQIKKLKSYDIKSAMDDPELEEILREFMN